MKRTSTILGSLVLTLAVASCATQPKAEVEARRPMTALELEYLTTLDALLPGMGADAVLDRREPQQQFERICMDAGRPGAAAERAALCRAIIERVGPEVAKPARVWLLRKIETIGRQESVPRLAALLNDDDAQIRELARRALQKNSSESAARALRNALDAAREPAWRIALINALADRGDRGRIDRIASLTDDADPAVARAAIAALGDLGGAAATERLYALWRAKGDPRREAAVNALLRVAERLVDRDERKVAGRVYGDLYRSSIAERQRVAALGGLVAARPQETLPQLVEIINDGQDRRWQLIAAHLAEGIPGQDVTRMLIRQCESTATATKPIFLDVLAARGDLIARPTAIEAAKSEHQDVRVAGLRALRALGTRNDVVLLAESASQSSGAEREAARDSLYRLRGEDIDGAILAAARQTMAGPVRAELVRCLPQRHMAGAVAVLFETAKDKDGAVRAAAFESLGKLAGESELPALVKLLVDESEAQAREAAEDAVVAVCLRNDDREARAEPVLAVLDDIQGLRQAALIRVLGRLRGPRALEVIRAALKNPEPEIYDAGVRALAQWDDAAVLDDLLGLARESSNETHQVLALRAYVRLLRLPNGRPASETFGMLQEAMALARKDGEKKLVLSALSEVKLPEALQKARSYLDDDALRDEAAVATLTLAKSLVVAHEDEARAAIEAVRAADISPGARKTLEETVDFIERHEGYVATWMVVGPYRHEGSNANELFATAFEPETSGTPGIEWRPLDAASSGNPWIFDLSKFSRGGNRCAYVKTMIWSARRQPARLEIGSDDGVKVWLNGELVHGKMAFRGVQPGSDRANVTLAGGWNTLMLKIVNGGGTWGFCCGVKSREGGAISGLRFEAD